MSAILFSRIADMSSSRKPSFRCGLFSETQRARKEPGLLRDPILLNDELAPVLTWQRERLQCCQPPRQSENMATVVQKQPLREGCTDLRFGQALGALQPDQRRNEV